MPSVYLSPLTSIFQFFNDTGVILAGGKVNTYLAGTSTTQATYTDSTGTVSNSNPIILAANGRLNNVEIWQPIGVKIKAIITDSNNNQIGPTLDQLAGINDPSAVQNTFYGGTDTGSANNYVLTFSPGFASYTNGQVIYWVPSNTSTGASVINVNGLGNISIVNPDGSAIPPGGLLANQLSLIAFQGGKFVSLVVQGSGTFIGTFAGITGSPTVTCSWTKVNKTVTMLIPGTVNSSTSTALTMSGVPASIQPATVNNQSTTILAEDNTAAITAWAIVNANTGTISFSTFSGAWTSSGSKGLPQGITITYQLL